MAKTDKICIVCGENFQGTAKSECCGANCRKRLERLKEAGKKPEFVLVGGKNTKAITFKAPPADSVKKEVQKSRKIKFKTATKESYDGEKSSNRYLGDEIGQMEKTSGKKLSKVDQLRFLKEDRHHKIMNQKGST